MSEQTALESLRFHWGGAYRIWHSPITGWNAALLGAAVTDDRYPLRAATAAGLRLLIRADYKPLTAARAPSTPR